MVHLVAATSLPLPLCPLRALNASIMKTQSSAQIVIFLMSRFLNRIAVLVPIERNFLNQWLCTGDLFKPNYTMPPFD
jgi:hypothetical protein